MHNILDTLALADSNARIRELDVLEIESVKDYQVQQNRIGDLLLARLTQLLSLFGPWPDWIGAALAAVPAKAAPAKAAPGSPASCACCAASSCWCSTTRSSSC